MLGLVVSLAVVLPGQAADAAPKVDLRCGLYCLYASLRALDLHPGSVEDLEAAVGQPSLLGYSLQQLADAARKHGAHALAVTTTLENLERRRGRFVAIALLEGRAHFVCIYDIAGADVFLADPPEIRQINRDAFRLGWKGKVLLISNKPLEPLGSPLSWILGIAAIGAAILVAGWAAWRLRTRRRSRSLSGATMLLRLAASLLAGFGCSQREASEGLPLIAAEPTAIQLGEVGPTDGTQSAHLILRNRGTAPLRILKVTASCSCSVPSGVPEAIPAGGEAHVRIAVQPKRTTGSHQSSLHIVTNDRSRPVLGVPISWREVAPVAFQPPSIDLGVIPLHQPIEQKIELVTAKPNRGLLWELITSTPDVDARLDEPKPVADSPATARFGMSIRLAPRTRAEDGTAEVIVRNAAQGLEARLPISWRASPPIAAFPSALFLSGVRPGNSPTGRLVVRMRDRAPVRVQRVELNGSDLPFETDTLEPETASQHAVLLKFPAIIKSGIHEYTARLTAVSGSDTHCLEIPVRVVCSSVQPGRSNVLENGGESREIDR